MTRRVAAAPISWGVCEVPGWGYQLGPDRVLSEMAQLGITATEFGPDGFLPEDGQQRRDLLSAYGLVAVGGFVPVVLHEAGHDPAPAVEAALRTFAAAGAGTLVLAAATGQDGYDRRPVRDAAGWRVLLDNLDRVDELARDAGVSAALHPHVGTMVERPDEIARVLDGSVIGLCLDTGHVLVGGADPVAVARDAASRITHVHLKDVDSSLAAKVRGGELGYRDAVASDLYRPLGTGDVAVSEIVSSLDANGYRGWYVMEQDVVLGGEPVTGSGPVELVRRCRDYLIGLAA